MLDDVYTCDCDDGYTDVNCSTPLQCILQNVTCSNGGECIENQGMRTNYVDKLVKYHFPNLSVSIHYNVYLLKRWHVAVFAPTDDWLCNCTDDYIGAHCDIISPCVSTAMCDDIGTRACTPHNASAYDCSCYETFSGEYCATGPCNDTVDAPCDVTGTSLIEDFRHTVWWVPVAEIGGRILVNDCQQLPSVSCQVLIKMCSGFRHQGVSSPFQR